MSGDDADTAPEPTMPTTPQLVTHLLAAELDGRSWAVAARRLVPAELADADTGALEAAIDGAPVRRLLDVLVREVLPGVLVDHPEEASSRLVNLPTIVDAATVSEARDLLVALREPLAASKASSMSRAGIMRQAAALLEMAPGGAMAAAAAELLVACGHHIIATAWRARGTGSRPSREDDAAGGAFVETLVRRLVAGDFDELPMPDEDAPAPVMVELPAPPARGARGPEALRAWLAMRWAAGQLRDGHRVGPAIGRWLTSHAGLRDGLVLARAEDGLYDVVDTRPARVLDIEVQSEGELDQADATRVAGYRPGRGGDRGGRRPAIRGDGAEVRLDVLLDEEADAALERGRAALGQGGKPVSKSIAVREALVRAFPPTT